MNQPVPNMKCDCCHQNDATRWFGNTSVVVCDNPECYAKIARNYNKALEEIENEDY